MGLGFGHQLAWGGDLMFEGQFMDSRPIYMIYRLKVCDTNIITFAFGQIQLIQAGYSFFWARYSGRYHKYHVIM